MGVDVRSTARDRVQGVWLAACRERCASLDVTKGAAMTSRITVIIGLLLLCSPFAMARQPDRGVRVEPNRAVGGPSAPGPLAPDDNDDDGVLNASDNCPDVYNPDQADLDGDGVGDSCDADLDGDGFTNDTDLCTWRPNPDQQDADADGVGDVCDGYPEGGPLELEAPVALPEPDADGSTDHNSLDIGTDGEGRIFVLIATTNFVLGENENLWVTRSEDLGMTWSAPVRLNEEASAPWNTYADMAVDDAGRIFVVWADTDGAVKLVRSTDAGQSFEAPLELAPAGSSPGGGAAVDAHGGWVYAVWDTDTEGNCGQSTIATRRSDDAGVSFEPEATAIPAGACIPEIEASSETTGRVHVSYRREPFTGPSPLEIATSDDNGASFGEGQPVLENRLPEGDSVFFPAQLAEGQASVLHTGWAEGDTDERGQLTYLDVWADYSLDGAGSFEDDNGLTDNFETPNAARLPGSANWDLVTLPGGSAYRVLLDGNLAAGYRPFYSLSSSGDRYSPPEPLDGRDGQGFTNQVPVIEHTSDGYTVFAFSQLEIGSGDTFSPFFVRTASPIASSVDEVEGLRWRPGSKQRLSWDAAAGALSYDVSRGLLSQLDSASDLSLASGFACDRWVREVLDQEQPEAGDGFYYLVRGRSGQSRGSWGKEARDTNMNACD